MQIIRLYNSIKMINFAPRKNETFYIARIIRNVSIVLHCILLAIENIELQKNGLKEVHPL